MINPKLKFFVGKVDDYYPVIEQLIKDNKREIFLKVFPDMPREHLKIFFLKKENKFLPIMDKVKENFEDSWSEINDLAFKELSKIMEEEWDRKEFLARITLLPICPRYLDYDTFDLNFNFADRTMKTICLHELSHFLFFKKIKRVFPNINKQDFEKPGILWEISEIIPGIIFQDFDLFEIQQEVIVYEDIKKSDVLGIFEKIYSQCNNFEDFIKESYNYLKSETINF